MEILQLLSSLLDIDGLKDFQPLLNLFKNGEFNLSTLLKNLTPEMLSPILNAFSKKESHTESVRHNLGLNPISNIADRDIVYHLNKYLED